MSETVSNNLAETLQQLPPADELVHNVAALDNVVNKPADLSEYIAGQTPDADRGQVVNDVLALRSEVISTVIAPESVFQKGKQIVGELGTFSSDNLSEARKYFANTGSFMNEVTNTSLETRRHHRDASLAAQTLESLVAGSSELTTIDEEARKLTGFTELYAADRSGIKTGFDSAEGETVRAHSVTRGVAQEAHSSNDRLYKAEEKARTEPETVVSDAAMAAATNRNPANVAEHQAYVGAAVTEQEKFIIDTMHTVAAVSNDIESFRDQMEYGEVMRGLPGQDVVSGAVENLRRAIRAVEHGAQPEAIEAALMPVFTVLQEIQTGLDGVDVKASSDYQNAVFMNQLVHNTAAELQGKVEVLMTRQ